MLENITSTETKGQTFLVVPPPSYTRKKKPPEDCYLSFTDQGPDGDYGSNKMVRKEPRTNRDKYFLIKTRATSVGSYRRNYSHKSVALFRTKAGGSTRANIEYLTCSFLEIDGATDSTIKTKVDVLTLARKNNLLEGLQPIETSKGHFHVIWTYNNPLPWTNKGESYWISQQKKLIQLFKQGGFLVDKGASMNPTQNLRNPSQLNAYNYKRRCKVEIHNSYQKTSLRAIYKALNAADIPNPTPMKASVRLRRDWRANKTFITTHKAYAKKHGVSERTIRRELQKAVQNGDLQIVRKVGNNKGILRKTEYLSKLYIEPNFQNGHLSICKNNSVRDTNLLEKFKLVGAEKGRRNKTAFVLAVGLSVESDKTATIEEIADQLREGAVRSGLSERELLRTIKNACKPNYNNFFSFKKMKQWDLIKKDNHFH